MPIIGITVEGPRVGATEHATEHAPICQRLASSGKPSPGCPKSSIRRRRRRSNWRRGAGRDEAGRDIADAAHGRPRQQPAATSAGPASGSRALGPNRASGTGRSRRASRARATEPSPRVNVAPRTSATGRPAVLPSASSAADASSSATARTVERMTRPSASGTPRRSSSGSSPDRPMATSTMPQRHGRPNESDTMTGTSTPKRARTAARMPAAEASGSRGRSVTSDPESGPTFDASTPPLAHTNPCGVSVMRTPFSMRTTRRASLSTTWTWRASRSKRWANSSASSPGTTPVRSMTAPSALDTIFWVTTSTSPSVSGRAPGVRSMASPMRPPTASPMRTSGIPSRARTEIGDGSAGTHALRLDRLDEHEVVGRIEVDRERAVDLDVRRADCLGRGSMGAPAARPEREVDDVGRPERERVRAAAVPVGDEDDDALGRSAGPSAAAATGSVSGARMAAIASDVTNGRSIGSTRTASAPPATTSSRASASPALRPRERWRSVRAPRSAARRRTSRSGLATSTSSSRSTAVAASTVRASNPWTRSSRSSASSRSPSRLLAPASVPTGMIAAIRIMAGPRSRGRPVPAGRGRRRRP